MSGIVDWLSSIAENIKNLPTLIWDSFKSAFDSIGDWLFSLYQGLLNLRNTISKFFEEGIKDIFVPDTEEISATFNSFVNEIKMKFGFNTDVFNTLFDGEMAVQDHYGDYNIIGLGTFKFKFLDTKFLYDGVEYFRPLIRGFLVLLMFLYNIKMILSFIRQDAGVVTGKAVEMGKESKK